MLPLLRRKQKHTGTRRTRVERVGIDDFDGLVTRLEACEQDGWSLMSVVPHPSYMVLFFTKGA